MLMHPVSSSDIAAIGWKQNTLIIRFNSGGTYSYSGVPEHVYRGLMMAPSHGKFFHANIKNAYSYQKIG